MNMYSATGNLGKDCRVAHLGNGTVCNFTLAVNRVMGIKLKPYGLIALYWEGKQRGNCLHTF